MTIYVAHVIPTGDLIEHDKAEECACGPIGERVEREDGSHGLLWTHNALDGREQDEPLPVHHARTSHTTLTSCGLPLYGTNHGYEFVYEKERATCPRCQRVIALGWKYAQ